MIDHDQPSIILEQRESSGSGRRRLPRRHSAIAMVRVDALVPVERMQSFKTNIAFMKSPGKLLNITRQMTTIDHPDSIFKICLQFRKWRLHSCEYILFQFVARLILTWKEKKRNHKYLLR